uniref:Methyltransferase n=1 Tax=viral metagenome TaxID=1070528 RepID=A0A6C0CST8_9ZZZZ
MKSYQLPLKKDAKVMFVCHGRTHPRKAPIKLTKKHWDNGFYVDIRQETEPDITIPIHTLPKDTYPDHFDAIVIIYCTLDAYMNPKKGELYKRFFQNVAHWLKPGGYLVSTGLPIWAIELLSLYTFPFKISRYEIMYRNLLHARFKDPQKYAVLKEKLLKENHPEKLKVLQTVENIKTYQQGETYLEIPPEKELQTMVQFGEMIKDITDGQLVLQESISDIDLYIFKK